ncbi:hypothetical protein [Leptolyngbya iicbica]|uniref:Uncharacterized protein n=2 Tax=Cyanophyceae TaxID=3028117 RepID=A0A4Q7E9W2_9CYAN|nr:hypothetical protein [Leptolyngbya sp. LK]RZM77785.1 hypothetical protein DYY88_14515 [Leptolyngbya sp. LK]
MKYFSLDPECPGSLADDVDLDTSVHPPLVESETLHIEFNTWMESALIEVFPCYCVTRELREAIEAMKFSGCSFAPAKVTKSETFNQFYPAGRHISEFTWLKVKGKTGVDDFGISKDHLLIVSERALSLIKEHGLYQCGVEPYRQ